MVIECPTCGKTRLQFRAKNHKTKIIKYKCLSCNKIFEIEESDILNDYLI